MENVKTGMSMKKKRLLFYIIASAVPIAQALVFYFFVNIRSFTLAFQTYDEGVFVFAGFTNFTQAIQDFGSQLFLQKSVTNSLLLFLVNIIFGSFPSILFSYYVYKKRLGAGFFKIILYLPHIISTVVFAIMYKYFIENAIPDLVFTLTGNKVEGMLYDVSNMNRVRICVMVFSIWISFGTNVLMYSGTMSSISESVIESGQLEGITPMRELISIVLPMIWPTFVTFMVSSLTGIFTNQMHLYTLFGTTAEYELYTFGYFLYRGTVTASQSEYPYLSAMGLLMTVIAVPTTLLVRWLLNKFGPSTD